MQQLMMQKRFMPRSYAARARGSSLLRGLVRLGRLTFMSRATVTAICTTFPGAEVSDPWGGGHDAWKVGGKMFACIGSMDTGVAVKTADVETAQMLIDAGIGERAKYFHRSWVLLHWGTGEDELRHRLETSYDLIRAGLTKKLQATLPPRA